MSAPTAFTTLPLRPFGLTACPSPASASTHGQSAGPIGPSAGACRRQRVDRRDPPCDLSRRQLDRHSRDLWPPSFGSDRSQGFERTALRSLSLYFHQMRPRLGSVQPQGGAAPGRRARQRPSRGRGVAVETWGRAHRPLPDALAGGGRDADRGLLADAARPQAGGEGASRRPLQPQRGAARGGNAVTAPMQSGLLSGRFSGKAAATPA
jgi:hypothetical protein